MPNDLKQALRRLLAAPGFTLIAILSLGLGIGANTALFSAMNALLLRPLPIAEPDRVLRYFGSIAEKGGGNWSLALPNLLDIERRATTLGNAAAWQGNGYTLAGQDTPERLAGARIQYDLFEVLGVSPAIGRGFAADEDTPSAPARVTVIGYDLWQRRFAGSRAVLGQTVQLNGVTHTIIGVMPKGFEFPFGGSSEIWTPFRQDETTWNRFSGGAAAVARLAPGATIEAAAKELEQIGSALATEYPASNTGLSFGLIALPEDVYGPQVRVGIFALFGAVAIVLLIACFNLASLLLARATDRENELAIRAAIGGSQGRIVLLFVLEGLLLGALGGIVGVVLSLWGNRLLARVAANVLPRSDEIGIDLRVLAFAIGLSLLTGVLVGLAPVAQSASPNLASLLREGARHTAGGKRKGRLRRTLVVAEVALALVLLAGAGLMLRSFAKLLAVDPGFNAENVLTATVSLDATFNTPELTKGFHDQVFQRLRAIPGVTAVGGSNALPFGGTSNFDDFDIEGRPATSPKDKPNTGSSMVTPGYFAAMGIRLLQGRDFADGDIRSQPGVAVISKGMADKYFPNEDPIGKRVALTWDRDSGTPYWRSVIGVVGDIRQGGLTEEKRAEMYVPFGQVNFGVRDITLVARTTVDPLSTTGAVQRAVWEVNRLQAVHTIMTMEQRIRSRVAYNIGMAWLFGTFALLALALTALGLYGVISYWVAQRTRELGIRSALGASTSEIVRLVVAQGLTLVGIGLVIGLAASLLAGRVMQSLLFGIKPFDPVTLAAVPLLLLVVTTVAAMLPALRASRIDPIIALRAE